MVIINANERDSYTVLKQLQVVASYSQVQAIYLGKLQLATLHQMYVRPILEYSSTVWAPYTNSNIDKLEAFQKHAARFVTSNYSYTSSVTAMMETLNWNTLHARRNILRLIMLYTIWLISLYQNLLLLQLLLIIQLCKRSQFTFQQNQCIQVTNVNT